MALAEEKVNLLSNFLISDKERAYRLLDLPPEEALEEMKAEGLDVTLHDVKEFGEELASLLNHTDELDEKALDSVAGGLVIAAGVLAAGIALFGAGLSGSIAVGIAICNHKGW